MNNKVFIGIIILLAAVAGFYIFSQKSKSTTSPQAAPSDQISKIGEKEYVAAMKKEDDKIRKGGKGKLSSRYLTYSKAGFEASSEKKRVLFFHAKWCPTCRTANSELEKNIYNFPEDVILFKTDYDTENELKKKYGITYQHTFVQVDASGKQLAKWNGGDINELIQNLK